MKVFIVLMILKLSFAQLMSKGEIETLFKKKFHNVLSRQDRENLEKLIDIAHRPDTVSERDLGSGPRFRVILECLVCKAGFSAFFHAVKIGLDEKAIIDTLTFFCVMLGIESKVVCEGAVALNVPILVYIIRNSPKASPTTYCSLLLQNDQGNTACPLYDPRFDWVVKLPPPRHNAHTIRCDQTKSQQQPLTIALLTDAHIDPFYEAYGVADCDAPTCCRKGQTPAEKYLSKSANIDEDVVAKSLVVIDDEVLLDLGVATKVNQPKSTRHSSLDRRSWFQVTESAPAGYWGDYRNCDTPIWAYDDVIDRIWETHKNVDVVYYIGDTIDHHVWETSYEEINATHKYMIDKIRSTFGDHVLVVPTIGNHESQPMNQYAPSSIRGEGINTTWLYGALADRWGFYLTEEAKKTLRKRGDFSVLVRPGLRAISLNNNVAYKYNWWLNYNPKHPKKHLDWLVEQLYKAELAGEKVHILMHIPPGDSDLAFVWTREYNRIVNRFSGTIAAQFSGHTHTDEFKIFYNEHGEASNVAWGAGGATTYSFYNLNYKIATFDTQTFAPLNIKNYVYNLTAANLTPNRRPRWFLLYDMRNSFQLPDLSPYSMGQLVHRMVTENRLLLDLYSAYYSKFSDAVWPSCNTDCKLDNLCKIVVTVLWQRRKCNELVSLYNRH